MFSFFKKTSPSLRNPPAKEQGLDRAEVVRSRKLLNVGGNNKAIPIPAFYEGWQHVLLDIDPAGAPDVVCDARALSNLPRAEYDSVYCSHNLEHYYRHDAHKVLSGFLHVLREDGFAFIRVPDMEELMKTVTGNDLDIDDFLYESPAGPITVRDVIYGYGREIETSGNDFYAHKNGFTRKSLAAILKEAGFVHVFTRTGNLEVTAVAFKKEPDDSANGMLDLSGAFSAESKPSPRIGRPDENCLRQGNELFSKGKLKDAAECYGKAISINPAYAPAHLNLGFVLKEEGLHDQAEQSLKQAIRLNPELEDAHYLLGGIAEAQGNLRAAIESYDKALAVKPNFEIVFRDLCRVLFLSGENERARAVIQKGISLNPQVADFHCYLGNLCTLENKHDDAIACYRKALAIEPDSIVVHANMGKAYLNKGDIENAATWYRKALQLDPASIESMSCLLFAHAFDPACPPDRYLAEARRYGSAVLANARPRTSWSAGSAGNGDLPLRVGLVSGDFLGHPVGFFLESVLKHLKAARIELFAYPTVPQEDDLTVRIKSCFGAWHSIAGLSDEAAAHRIHDDGIHILIDLAGHTSHNRLPVFAWKPAPVQASWLGYFASTGVPGIDYLLADRASVPEFHREDFTEAIWYLPDTRLCFTPPTAVDEMRPAPLPALRNGYITYGCFQNLSKINDGLLAAWGRIFLALPQARLRIQCKQMGDPAAREILLQRLSTVGISSERVAIHGPTSRKAYLAAHAEVDAILDTFPYPGGTTTCEALWMGVPTLTLAGKSLLSRQGASMLACTGLGDWIAGDVDEYVAKATGFAGDFDRLAQLRAVLREKVLASPLFDAPRFAANLEDALHEMWQRHKQATPAEAGHAPNGRSRS